MVPALARPPTKGTRAGTRAASSTVPTVLGSVLSQGVAEEFARVRARIATPAILEMFARRDWSEGVADKVVVLAGVNVVGRANDLGGDHCVAPDPVRFRREVRSALSSRLLRTARRSPVPASRRLTTTRTWLTSSRLLASRLTSRLTSSSARSPLRHLTTCFPGHNNSNQRPTTLLHYTKSVIAKNHTDKVSEQARPCDPQTPLQRAARHRNQHQGNAADRPRQRRRLQQHRLHEPSNHSYP